MDFAAYLRRIAFDGSVRPDVATLEALHRAHLFAVPFENLSIGWGEPIAIDLAAHYAKIVDRRRGGFCYEQNHLFGWALERIGFRLTQLGAAVWADRDGEIGYGDPASHLLLRVDLDEPWIADVGFCDHFRAPMPLRDGFVREEEARAYRLDRETEDGEVAWTLSTRAHGGDWTPGYRFADVERPMTYFAAMCRFHQTSPRSPFTRKRLCSLAGEDGRVTLSGDDWIVTDRDGTRHVRAVADEAEAAALPRGRFGITVPRPATPEPRDERP